MTPWRLLSTCHWTNSTPALPGTCDHPDLPLKLTVLQVISHASGILSTVDPRENRGQPSCMASCQREGLGSQEALHKATLRPVTDPRAHATGSGHLPPENASNIHLPCSKGCQGGLTVPGRGSSADADPGESPLDKRGPPPMSRDKNVTAGQAHRVQTGAQAARADEREKPSGESLKSNATPLTATQLTAQGTRQRSHRCKD